MSEEKTIGQLAYIAADKEFCQLYGDEVEDIDDRLKAQNEFIEMFAQAVIAEFLRRNGEPLAFVDDKGELTLTVKGLFKLEIGDKLFAAPQSLGKDQNK